MLAERYIRDGHVVGIVGRRGDKLAEVAKGHSEVHCLKADVTDISQIAVHLSALAGEMGGLDLLVLCSGVGRMNPDLDYGLELPTVDTNVRGWTAVTDWAFSFFMQQGYGHLAAISSVAGIRGLAPAPAYSASKAYQIHYLEALRQRARISRKRVCVTDVRPGFVRTPLLSHPEKLFWVDEPKRRLGAIYRAISARKKSRDYPALGVSCSLDADCTGVVGGEDIRKSLSLPDKKIPVETGLSRPGCAFALVFRVS